MPLQRVSTSSICLYQLKLTDSSSSGCAWVASGHRPGLGQALGGKLVRIPINSLVSWYPDPQPYIQQNWPAISAGCPLGCQIRGKKEAHYPQCCCPAGHKESKVYGDNRQRDYLQSVVWWTYSSLPPEMGMFLLLVHTTWTQGFKKPFSSLKTGLQKIKDAFQTHPNLNSSLNSWS